MSLVEILIVTIGSAMGKSLLKIWLKEQPLLEAASASSLDLLKSKTADILSARKAEREFETLGDRIAKSLEPIFRSSNLQENSYGAVANEVASAISDANISSQLLAKISYSPVRLLEHIKIQHPNGNILFSESETSLYNRVLDLSAQYIVDLASNLPGYTAQNFTQILQRLDVSMETLKRILDDLEKLRIASEFTDQNRQYADFERDYRALIVRRLDRVNLFGADISRRTKRYQLSIAYVSLEVANPHFWDDDNDTVARTDVQEALSDSWQTAIIGEAGTGKTTLLYWLAVNSAAATFTGSMNRWNNTVPFIIELRRYSEGLPAPENFLNKVAFDIADRMPQGWVHYILQSGRAVLLIDGLDEVPETQRETVYEWLENLYQSFERVRIVFTSRPASYKWGELAKLDFKEYELAPMQPHQIECFINYWHQAVLGDENLSDKEKVDNIPKKLLYKIRNNPPLTRLSTNPLLCAMLCALHYDRNMQLPADRGELYEACCSMLLERRDSEREIDAGNYPKLSYKQKRVLLDDLAYWMMKNQHVSAEKWQVVPRIKQKLNNMHIASDFSEEMIVSFLVERSGIIREPAPGSIDFIHRTFQEYMAASAASLEGDWGFLLDRVSDDQWQETIILAVGLTNKKQADYFIRSLLKKGKETSGDKHRFDLLSVSCLETVTEISSAVRKQVEQRVNSLIPPKHRDELKPLAAAGEIAVPYLNPKPQYTLQESVACVEVLQMIGTQSAFKQALSYLKSQQTPVIEEVYNFLDLVTPQEVAANGSDSLIEYISESICGNEVRVHGKVLHALSSVPLFRIKQAFTSTIKKIYLDYCNNDLNHNLSIVSQLLDLEELIIDGYVDSLQELAELRKLRILDIRNYSSSNWPSFSTMRSLASLTSLKLSSGSSWPVFSELEYFPSLEKLSLLSSASMDLDFQVIDSISNIKNLRYIHLALLGKNSFWPSLASLRWLNCLKTLEISSNSDFGEIDGFDELPQLERLVINSVSKRNISQDLLYKLGIFCPDCLIEITEGWNEAQW